MLEGLVAWVLNNYLGKYVENLNTDQLSVALLSGKVELENLPLRKDALRHLGLPVEIKAGFIGKVQLQVPVRQIRSAPWLIAIEKLYLVATPVNMDEYPETALGVAYYGAGEWAAYCAVTPYAVSPTPLRSYVIAHALCGRLD